MQSSFNAVSESFGLLFDFRIRSAIVSMLLLCLPLSQGYAFESKFPRVCVIDNTAFKSEAQNVARSLSLPLTSEIDDKDTELFSHALSIAHVTSGWYSLQGRNQNVRSLSQICSHAWGIGIRFFFCEIDKCISVHLIFSIKC